MMWVLVLAVFLDDPDVTIISNIHEYDTKVECVSEKKRVSVEMSKAYPEDRNFALVCIESIPDEDADSEEEPKPGKEL